MNLAIGVVELAVLAGLLVGAFAWWDDRRHRDSFRRLGDWIAEGKERQGGQR